MDTQLGQSKTDWHIHSLDTQLSQSGGLTARTVKTDGLTSRTE